MKIIGNLETMHDSDLPTFLIISLPIIFKRTRSNSVSFFASAQSEEEKTGGSGGGGRPHGQGGGDFSRWRLQPDEAAAAAAVTSTDASCMDWFLPYVSMNSSAPKMMGRQANES